MSVDYNRLILHEGKSNHMYLDTNGCVTVGVGHLITSSSRALLIEGWEPASELLITTDYRKVVLAKAGMRVGEYERLTTVRLPDAAVMRLLEYDYTSCLEVFRNNYFQALDTYPEAIQRVLGDMAFNMGPRFLFKFPKFLTALRLQDWETAAKECYRPDVGRERNDWAKKQIESLYDPGFVPFDTPERHGDTQQSL